MNPLKPWRREHNRQWVSGTGPMALIWVIVGIINVAFATREPPEQ